MRQWDTKRPPPPPPAVLTLIFAMRSLCCYCMMWIYLFILISCCEEAFPVVQCKRNKTILMSCCSKIHFSRLILKIKEMQTKWDLIEIWLYIRSSMHLRSEGSTGIPPGRVPLELFQACPTGRRPWSRSSADWRHYISGTSGYSTQPANRLVEERGWILYTKTNCGQTRHKSLTVNAWLPYGSNAAA